MLLDGIDSSYLQTRILYKVKSEELNLKSNKDKCDQSWRKI